MIAVICFIMLWLIQYSNILLTQMEIDTYTNRVSLLICCYRVALSCSSDSFCIAALGLNWVLDKHFHSKCVSELFKDFSLIHRLEKMRVEKKIIVGND